MLIGDWNRNEDQWRWGEYKVEKWFTNQYQEIEIRLYKYDGALLTILMNMPLLRHMQSFENKIKMV
jgi:hypothetical protein